MLGARLFALLGLCLLLCPVQASVLQRLALPAHESPDFPRHLPETWQAGYVREPVFNSRILLVEAGRGQAETVILVHGLGQNGHRDWLNVMPELARHYHVLALDLPGFGFSDKPAGRYSPTQYARVLQWLVAATGRERVHLVGHSMGGAVALRFATSFPDQLERLTLVSVAGVLERSAFVQHSSALPLQWDSIPAPVRGLAAEPLRHWGGKLLDIANNLPDPTSLLHQYQGAWDALLGDSPNINAALALMEEDYTAALGQVTVPTLIIWGDQDPVTPMRTGELLANNLPTAELVVFPATGHVPMQHRGKFSELLLSHLSGKRQLQPLAALPTEPNEDLFCQGHNGQRFTGRYKAVKLIACKGVVLENLVADSIHLENAEVTLRNVRVTADKAALSAFNSQVKGTSVELRGEQAIRAGNSRLDLAGARLYGRHAAVVATEESRFIFSVSHTESPDYEGGLHGVYRLGAQPQ